MDYRQKYHDTDIHQDEKKSINDDYREAAEIHRSGRKICGLDNISCELQQLQDS